MCVPCACCVRAWCVRACYVRVRACACVCMCMCMCARHLPAGGVRAEGALAVLRVGHLGAHLVVILLKHLHTHTHMCTHTRTRTQVYIHCAAGISRSTTVTCAYLMTHLDLPFEDVLRFVRARRSIVCPNRGFREQVPGLYVYLVHISIYIY